MLPGGENDKILSNDKISLALSYHRNVMEAVDSREVIYFVDIYHLHNDPHKSRNFHEFLPIFLSIKYLS